MIILGINAYHGDASAVLLRDGELFAAIEEERFRRIKHWAGFPREAIRTCLDMADVTPAAIDHIAISRNPRANVLRKAVFAAQSRPSLGLVKDRVNNASRVHDIGRMVSEAVGVDRDAMNAKIHWVEHHPAHLGSAFFASPFEEAAVCAIDGFGDFVSTSVAVGRGEKLEVLDKVNAPGRRHARRAATSRPNSSACAPSAAPKRPLPPWPPQCSPSPTTCSRTAPSIRTSAPITSTVAPSERRPSASSPSCKASATTSRSRRSPHDQWQVSF